MSKVDRKFHPIQKILCRSLILCDYEDYNYSILYSNAHCFSTKHVQKLNFEAVTSTSLATEILCISGAPFLTGRLSLRIVAAGS